MPTPWLKRIRETGQLSVHTIAGAWAAAVDKSVVTFNGLGFPVRLVNEKEENKANIVVKLSSGPDSYKHYVDVAATGSDFDASRLHGLTSTLTDSNDRKKKYEIFFAAIFLPGKAQATNGQKEVILVHEFIHACGLDGGMPDGSKNKNQDHDSIGIMFAQMAKEGDGLIEYLHDKGAKAMPPIRVGPQTICKTQMIWGSEACKKD